MRNEINMNFIYYFYIPVPQDMQYASLSQPYGTDLSYVY